MNEIVRVKSAPGLKWKNRSGGVFEARWQCRTDIVEKGYKVKSVKLWSGTGDPELEDWNFIVDVCTQLQQEMLVWNRGGLPTVNAFNGTLGGLIYCYRNDPDSNFRKREDRGGLRYASRLHYDALMGMIEREHGTEQVAEIKGRTVQHWYDEWSIKSVATAHAKIKMLRTLFSFGTAFLEDDHCARVSAVLSKMKFAMPQARSERLTAEQANAIRAEAHRLKRRSIALGQGFQFELMFRQKDVIGEWVPMSEHGTSDVLNINPEKGANEKWLRGVRWTEIDANLILTHVTSKKKKPITINLRNAPMVMEELALIAGVSPAKLTRDMLPAAGPIIVSEFDGLPYTAYEYRRWWRICASAAGVPDSVRNMDSRAGAITEASDAGADLEHIRHAATHSNISMTQRYSRGAEGKIAEVQRLRVESRNKPRTETT